MQEWVFSSVPPEEREGLRPFRVPRFTRTLSMWLNLLIEVGFVIERFGEPYPDDEATREYPGCRRPGVRLLPPRPGPQTGARGTFGVSLTP